MRKRWYASDREYLTTPRKPIPIKNRLAGIRSILLSFRGTNRCKVQRSGMLTRSEKRVIVLVSCEMTVRHERARGVAVNPYTPRGPGQATEPPSPRLKTSSPQAQASARGALRFSSHSPGTSLRARGARDTTLAFHSPLRDHTPRALRIADHHGLRDELRIMRAKVPR